MTEPRKRPNRLGMYEDIRAVLDEALRTGGGEYELADHGKAVWWRQRAYTFRKLYANTIYPKPSPYDTLSFKKVPPESATVVIASGQQRGVFRPANTLPPVTSEPVDSEMQREADDLARRLGLDGDVL